MGLSIGGFLKFYLVSWFWKDGHLNWFGILAMIVALVWIFLRLRNRDNQGVGGGSGGGANYRI